MNDTESEDSRTDEPDKDPWDATSTENAAVGRPAPSWMQTLRVIGVVVGGIALIALGVKQLTSQAQQSESIAKAQSSSPAEPASRNTGDPESVAQPQPTNVISTSNAVRRASVLEIQSDIQIAQELIVRLTKEQKRWDEFVTSIETGDVGRRIAADDKAVELFAAALVRDRISPEKTVGLQQSLLAIAKPVKQAASDESAILEIDNGFTKQLNDIRSQLKLGLRQWEEDNGLVRLLAREAKLRAPADNSLSEAIERLRAIQLRQRAEQIATKVKASEAALAEQEAASQIELQELETQKQLERDKVTAARKKAELAGLKTEQIALADQIAAAREKAKLELAFQAALPEIRSVLVPFTADGHKQIVNGEWTYLEEKQPLSLSGLRSFAVLDDDSMSFQRLFFVGGGQRNDRPNGPFPNYIGGHIHDNNMPLARKVQRLLNTFGELMVEKKMLRP